MKGPMLLLVLLLVAACPGAEPPHPDAGPDDEEDAGEPEVQGLRTVLDDEDDLAEMASAQGVVKFLLQVAGATVTPPILDPCVFQNTTLFPFHLPFLLAQPGGEGMDFDQYIANVITRATRVWWGGEVVFLSTLPHPLTQQPGVLVFGVYTEDTPGNRLEVDDVRAVFTLLDQCAPFYEGQLAFQPTSSEQIQLMNLHVQELADEGIAVVFP